MSDLVRMNQRKIPIIPSTYSQEFGCQVPSRLETQHCGGTPWFDHDSGIGGYRCDICGAIIGSVGQPKSCKEMNI